MKYQNDAQSEAWPTARDKASCPEPVTEPSDSCAPLPPVQARPDREPVEAMIIIVMDKRGAKNDLNPKSAWHAA